MMSKKHSPKFNMLDAPSGYIAINRNAINGNVSDGYCHYCDLYQSGEKCKCSSFVRDDFTSVIFRKLKL